MQPIGVCEKDANDSIEATREPRMMSPIKITNDRIMDRKLEEEFQSLKVKSQSKIVHLTKDDMFDMLKSLDMICSNRWNKVTQRDY